jgi:hypothetical protein
VALEYAVLGHFEYNVKIARRTTVCAGLALAFTGITNKTRVPTQL